MKNSIRTFIITVLAVLLLFLAGLSIYMIVNTQKDRTEAKDAYADLNQQFVEQAPSSAPAEGGEEEFTLPAVDWEKLKASYPDVVGWIYAPNTAIDYPVVQSHDNSEYLTKMPDGTTNKHGSIFVDARNNGLLSEQNTILYGHNMKDGSMFHSLFNWQDAEFAAQNPIIYLLTPDRNYELHLFTACISGPSSSVYSTSCEGDAGAWADSWARKSAFKAEFVPTGRDSFVTLSTCTSGENRFVVVAVPRQAQ